MLLLRAVLCRSTYRLFDESLRRLINASMLRLCVCRSSYGFSAELHGNRRQFDEHSPPVGRAASQAPQRRHSALRGSLPPAAAVNRRLDHQHDRQVRHGGGARDFDGLQLHDPRVHGYRTGPVEQPAAVSHFPAL